MEKDYRYNVTSFEHPVHVPLHQKNEKSILQELDEYEISIDIKHRAQQVYRNLGPRVHRGNKRLQLLFYCSYAGHLELHAENPAEVEEPNPSVYEKLFGLTHGDARKAMAIFSESQTGYRPKTGKSNPLGMIKGYCRENHISDEMVGPIKALGRKILAKDPELKEEYPQTVAAGLIKYGLNTMGGELDNESFAKTVNLSQATINSMYKRIARIDNSDE